ncbi:hypothetical protein ACWDO0_34370 [Nocardia rhamnosiphila]
MTEPQEIPDEVITAKWREMSPLIERVTERIGTATEFPVAAGSSLAEDDVATTPYHVSHAVRSCLTSGVDHLHALKSLVVDGGLLHTSAPFSLARGSLENLSLGYWILHPKNQIVRVERALRWHAQNYLDAERALKPRKVGNSKAGPKILKLEAVARRTRGVPVKAIGEGHSSTTAVRYASTNSVTAGSVLFAWQLCSGFAHGRPWAVLGASERKLHPTEDPDVTNIELTASSSTVLWVALESLHLLTDVLRTYSQRAEVDLDPLNL